MPLSTDIVAANAQLLRRSAIQGHCSHRAARTEIGGLLTDAVDCANVYSHRVAAPGAWRRTVGIGPAGPASLSFCDSNTTSWATSPRRRCAGRGRASRGVRVVRAARRAVLPGPASRSHRRRRDRS